MTYYDDFEFSSGRTVLIDSDGNKSDFCQEFKVTEKLICLDDKTIYLRVAITLDNGEPRDFIVPREELSGKVYSTLVANGLSVSKVHEYVITITEILFETEAAAKHSFCHKKLGYKLIDGRLVYFGEKAFDDMVSSTYIGPVKFEKRGTFESWRDGLAKIVDKHPEQIIVLAMSASAPIVALLEICGITSESLLCAIIGLTSKGKSTSIFSAGAVWSRSGIKGIIDTVAGSQNYLYASLGGKIGFPHFIDETTIRGRDMGEILFKLAMGREGGKCLPDGTPREERMWSTSIVMTGEISPLSLSTNGGLHARLIEFDLNWTGSGEVADEILEHIALNYGTAYPHLIAELSRFSLEGLVAFYRACCADLTKKLTPESGVEIRIVKKLAILLMTAYIISKAWGFRVRKRDMNRLLKQIYKNNLPNADKVDVCYDYIMSYIVKNRSLFPSESKNGCMSVPLCHTSCQGVTGERKYKRCCWMLDTVFDGLLAEKGLDPSRNVLWEMHDRGMIEHFTDRFRKTHNIGGVDVPCVCVFLGSHSTSQAPPKNFIPNINTSHLTDLLSDDDDDEDDDEFEPDDFKEVIK